MRIMPVQGIQGGRGKARSKGGERAEGDAVSLPEIGSTWKRNGAKVAGDGAHFREGEVVRVVAVLEADETPALASVSRGRYDGYSIINATWRVGAVPSIKVLSRRENGDTFKLWDVLRFVEIFDPEPPF
jgi:hypothetical protein